MRTRTRLLTGLGVVIVLAGAWLLYNPTRTITWTELAAAAQPNLHNTIITTSDYCGSKDGFDYFVIFPPASRAQKYRVPESDSPIGDRFAFTQERSRWRSINVMSGAIVTISTNQIAP